MELSTLEITPEEATERLAEYDGLLQAERTAEDVAIAQGYRAAKRGLQIIRMSEVISAGGYFTSGRPRLAVVRADAGECYVDVEGTWGDGPLSIIYSSDGNTHRRNSLVGANHVRVRVERPELPNGKRIWHGRTVVPLIPPRHRPKPSRIRGCHILWEVEKWDPTPPVDPALIRHIRGDLWSVLAVWDLTDLERAVLSQRIAR